MDIIEEFESEGALFVEHYSTESSSRGHIDVHVFMDKDGKEFSHYMDQDGDEFLLGPGDKLPWYFND